MELPRLKVRPMSTQTTTVFRGLERRPGAGIGSWNDERNLSADLAPTLGVRAARALVEDIDGNKVSARIEAICGGDHLCLLDEKGILWSNGHSINIGAVHEGDFTTTWTTEMDEVAGGSAAISPASGEDKTGGMMGGLTEHEGSSLIQFFKQGGEWDWDFPQCTITYPDGSWGALLDLETDYTDTLGEVIVRFFPSMPEESQFTLTIRNAFALNSGWGFRLNVRKYNPAVENARMLRMGAMVIIYGNNVRYWANAVKLAAGEEMVYNQDYGLLDMDGGGKLSRDDAVITLCDINGDLFSGVVTSEAEPQRGTNYWLDISGQSPVLRHWQASNSAWMVVSATFVRISPVSLADEYGTKLRTGDTIHIVTYSDPDVDVGGDQAKKASATKAVQELFASAHYIYKAEITEPVFGTGYMVVSGMLPFGEISVRSAFSFRRKAPEMGFVVEAGNRLWGCRYDESQGINEIYGSKLGDPANWEVYQGLSTDSWSASRGTAAPFTGAAVLDGCPLFFRAASVEKIYPSPTGAHQIQSFDLEGVEPGSAESLVVIEGRLYYKARSGIMVYTGTMPQRISDSFGQWKFENACGGRNGRKYVLAMDGPLNGESTSQKDNKRVCAVYDLDTGDWHLEDEAWEGRAVTWGDQLYYLASGDIYRMDGDSREGVNWWAETGPQGIAWPEHKWISYIRFRLRLDPGAELRVYIAYDDGDWIEVARAEGTYLEHPNRLGPAEINFTPRRCDHFRLRIGGTGGCQIYSITWRQEQSEGRR